MTSKSNEIKRLTTPLKIKEFKAYDNEGELLKCSETLSDVRFMIEPKENILNDNEIIQYAPQSKSASKIRLKNGIKNLQDILLIHESLIWALGLYYVILISISIPVLYFKNMIGIYLVLALIISPVIYLYYIINLKNYTKIKAKKENKKIKQKKTTEQTSTEEIQEVESLKKYEKEIYNLKVLFDVKQEVVRDLIKKRFEPPQITYDKFISLIDSCHKIFYSQYDGVENIIKLAADDSPKVQNEINNKINIMKKIINQIEDLTNELVININSSQESEQDVSNLLDDMGNLIESVKKY